MSQENVEIVRRAVDGRVQPRDVDAAATDLASDCEFVPTGGLPGSRDVYHGPEGFRQFIPWLRDEFDHARLDVNDVRAIRDARLVHGQAFTGRAEALGAAGLSE